MQHKVELLRPESVQAGKRPRKRDCPLCHILVDGHYIGHATPGTGTINFTDPECNQEERDAAKKAIQDYWGGEAIQVNTLEGIDGVDEETISNSEGDDE